jgi:hypothetical protein
MYSAPNAEDGYIEKVEMTKNGCPIQNDYLQAGLSFRSISDTQVESNAFEAFKLRSSAIFINCWVQICIQKSRCSQQACSESFTQATPLKLLTSNRYLSLFKRSSINPTSYQGGSHEKASNVDNSFYKEVRMRINVEDPYGVQQNSQNSMRSINSIFPNVIGILFAFNNRKN